MRPMNDFDPDKVAKVHDQNSDGWFVWDPATHGRDWHKGGFSNFGDGIVEWGDLLLDGWEPLASGAGETEP